VTLSSSSYDEIDVSISIDYELKIPTVIESNQDNSFESLVSLCCIDRVFGRSAKSNNSSVGKRDIFFSINRSLSLSRLATIFTFDVLSFLSLDKRSEIL
jgi:hypothetical protein